MNFNQLFYNFLVTELGRTGHINDLMVEFFQRETGSSSRSLNDLWKEWISGLVSGRYHINDSMMEHFLNNGLTASYNDNFAQAVMDGLYLANTGILKENGDFLLTEAGDYLLQE